MKISIIVAVSENNVIGCNGKIPWHIPEDLGHFKELTLSHHILMGRKTFESIGRPLPGRINLVVSSNLKYKPEGVSVFSTTHEAIEHAKYFGERELMVIGGESIYKEVLPMADTIYLTKIGKRYEGNVRFPEINKEDWSVISSELHSNNPDFEFQHLERRF